MTDRPILFQDEMVRAILDDRKTVTRRVGPTWASVTPATRLWVRECFALPARHNSFSPAYIAEACRQAGYSHPWAPIWYRADGSYNGAIPVLSANDPGEWGGRGRWRPSIHLPRWACRLELEVVSVTEERCVLGGGLGQMAVLMPGVTDEEARRDGFASRSAFLALWMKLHPDYSGTVYRVEFRRVTP